MQPLPIAGTADPGPHSSRKPSRAVRSGWVFAVGVSLLVHAGLFKLFLWADTGARGRVASSVEPSRVMDAQLLSAPAPAVQTPAPEPVPPPKAAPPPPPPEPVRQQGRRQGAHESGAPLSGAQAYLEPSEVDLTAQPLEDLRLEAAHWPPGADELRVAVWVSEAGAIVGWQVQGFDSGERHIQQMFAAFSQTPMTPAFKNGHAVASVLYLALARP